MLHLLNYELLWEAESIPVVKDGDLKLPVDEIFIRTYDKRTRYSVDWITQYNYVSENSLTKDEFNSKIKDAGYTPDGLIYEPVKKKLTFNNGKIYYRHILNTVQFK